MKKSKIISIIVLVLLIGVITYICVDNYTVNNLKARSSGGGSSSSLVGNVINLIGTGRVASSTSLSTQTLFQFATGTSQAQWDTGTGVYPASLGATPTAAFLINNTSIVGLDFYYQQANASSTVSCDLMVSNDNNCGVGSNATNTTEWWPLPVNATSSVATNINGTSATTTITFVSLVNDVTNTMKHYVPLEDVSYNCMRLQCYNSSTTDGSLLHVKSRTR